MQPAYDLCRRISAWLIRERLRSPPVWYWPFNPSVDCVENSFSAAGEPDLQNGLERWIIPHLSKYADARARADSPSTVVLSLPLYLEQSANSQSSYIWRYIFRLAAYHGQNSV
jgi:hypothetical protein